jgi:hypothetical protein
VLANPCLEECNDEQKDDISAALIFSSAYMYLRTPGMMMIARGLGEKQQKLKWKFKGKMQRIKALHYTQEDARQQLKERGGENEGVSQAACNPGWSVVPDSRLTSRAEAVSANGPCDIISSANAHT